MTTALAKKDSNRVSAIVFVFAIVIIAYLIFDAGAHQEVFQLLLSAGIVILAMVLIRIPDNENVRLALSFMAAFAAIRMMVWRVSFTLNLTSPFNALATFALLFGESYAVLGFFLLLIQNFNLNRRQSIPYDAAYTPSVDIFICSYNESVDIVRRTICGAKYIDYPNKKVYLLDDGRRQPMLDLAMALGVEYITRPDNRFAKAGNINNALPQTHGELILILDADHIAARTMLQKTTPYMKDAQVGFVQTAHRFMNSAPIQRNLRIEGKLPHEQELFFQVSMVGKDNWNAAIFAGSAGVLRRSILMELGGMATGTVIEDCEFSLKMHRKRYKSIYLPEAQSIGLCPETLSAYMIQQSRWAKGQTQMLVMGNPLTGEGLTVSQRICYLINNLYYLFGIPRITYIFIPIVFLLFGVCATSVSWFHYTIMTIAFYFTWIVQQRYVYKNFRHSFWSDVYEVVLAPFVAYWSAATLLDPEAPRFSVTPKGQQTKHYFFDLQIIWPNLVLLALCIFAFLVGSVKLLLAFDPVGNIANLTWCGYNIMIITCAVLVGLERPQVRRVHRVHRRIPVSVSSEHYEGGTAAGVTLDISEYGARVHILAPKKSFHKEDRIVLSMESDEGDLTDIQCRIARVFSEGEFLNLEVEFKDLDLAMIEKIICMVYCSANTWGVLKEPYDSLLSSIGELLQTPLRVLNEIRRNLISGRMIVFVPTAVYESKYLPAKWKAHLDDEGRAVRSSVLTKKDATTIKNEDSGENTLDVDSM